ncbi:cupin domain-containing protein (plasmid) [Priestia megaterium]|nr:cupin domain-containing protein [Priestia megaterium]
MNTERRFKKLMNYKVHESDITPLTDKGGEVRVLLSPRTVKSTQLIMGVATIPPGEIVKEHLHDYGEECFYVQKGTGKLILRNLDQLNFKAGDALIIPQGTIHSIENIGEEDIEVVFATAPLAPTAREGHRNL